ncbi:MAG: heavy metal sensor histidine kinase [Burkholderiaceae bacterium]
MPVKWPRRRPISLALRITAFVALATTLLFVIFAVQMSHSIEKHFAEQDLGELQAVATSLQNAFGNAAVARGPDALDSRLAHAVNGHHDVYFNVQDGSGAPHDGTAPVDLIQITQLIPPAPVLNGQSLHIWRTEDRTYRGAVLTIGSARVLVAIAIDFHLAYLAHLQQLLVWGTLVVCAVSVLASWLAVKWGHAPMRRISSTVRGITSEQLHVRLVPDEVPVELEHLVASFNLMLDRLQQSFERLSHFSVDIAHELRTPVTNLTTQTQVAVSKQRSAEAYREVLYESLEELERLGKTIGDMLFLAQAEHPFAKPEVADVDLAQEVRALFDYFEAWADDRSVELSLVGSAPCVPGDRLMLRRALSNLISNGLRYVPRGQRLNVKLALEHQTVVLSVENPGPDIPSAHLPKLFDRFYRVDPARQRNGEGSGLGLAIVKSIVQAHGGTVSARSGEGMTSFMLQLPTVGKTD